MKKKRIIWWIIERLEDLIAWLEPMGEDYEQPNAKLAEFTREINREYVRDMMFKPYMEETKK